MHYQQHQLCVSFTFTVQSTLSEKTYLHIIFIRIAEALLQASRGDWKQYRLLANCLDWLFRLFTQHAMYALTYSDGSSSASLSSTCGF